MKIYTNANNTSTLKLVIAAALSRNDVELVAGNLNDNIFSGPKCLPVLVVDEETTFFSSNAAVQFLLPVPEDVQSACNQLQELEATRLHPAVQVLVSAKTVASDLKQLLSSLLSNLDGILAKKQYLISESITAVDITFWSTLYPLYYNRDHKQYLNDLKHVTRWFEAIAVIKEVQESIKRWGGKAEGPYGQTYGLGLPQITSVSSPIGSPEEMLPVSGPTAEELARAKDLWESGLTNMPTPLKRESVILPIEGARNVLITSALPYVNNVPHLGNIIGCVLSADIFARYCRMCNYNVLYISGTDEYGTATETKALEEGVSPRQICDKYFALHKAVYDWFDISFDKFGRTSTKEQTEITQKIFLKLQQNGFISCQAVDQLHCEKCNRFLADRFVEGTCHHPGCGYDSARGDQCDACGKLINATELISPRCKVCGETPVKKVSKQLFLELGQLEAGVRLWAGGSHGSGAGLGEGGAVGWSGAARAAARGWLSAGLRARAITRDLTWGVPVPKAPGNEDFANKVFYVWFDAPIGYMSITQSATGDYERWWKPSAKDNVKLYQFMAKDNVPFHAVMFPATLLGVNEGHLLVSHIYATEYLNYEEGKFSKSRGVGVFGNDVKDTGIPADVWRFYLASIRPESSDSSFSWAELGTRNNSELLNNLGNFCHRSLSFCASSFKGVVPRVSPAPGDYELMVMVNREVLAYVAQLEKGRLREGLRHVLAIGKLGNQHMQARQPWLLLKGTDDEREQAATAIGMCCQIVALLCLLLFPYMPATSRRLSKQLNIDLDKLRLNSENPSLLQFLGEGHSIGKPEPLFTKIEADRLEELRKKYAGTQTDRKNAETAKVSGPKSIKDIEAAITVQGEKVRQLKSSTKDKAIWQPEVNKLLDLKKQLAILQQNEATKAPPAAANGNTVADLEAAVAAQGDKVRKLKSSTKDKSVWQPEVNILLDLKKQLAALQVNK